MAVHVDELVSSVTGEADSAATGASPPATWEEITKASEAQARAARDRLRTASEGYDD